MARPQRHSFPKRLPQVSQRNHLLLMVALLFLLGCLSVLWLNVGPWMWLTFGLGAALALCLHMLGASGMPGAAVCVFALAALYAQWTFDTSQPEPGVYEITAVVYGEATPRSDQRLAFILGDLTLDGVPVSGKAYCTLHYPDEPPDLFDGARLRFPGRVYLPDGPSGKPHFDFRLWMRQRGLDFGIAVYKDVTVENTRETAPAADKAYRVRQAIRGVFERLMGDDSRVPVALLLGDRDSLQEGEYQAFQRLGIAHIMSVSGLHVSLLGGLLLMAMRRLEAPRWLTFALLLPLMGFYCWLTGFSAAANRAAVMLLLGMLARTANRRAVDRLTLLAGGMLAVLLINPLHASSAGFILSFTAMLSIVLFVPPLSQLLDTRWSPLRLRATDGVLRRLLARAQRSLKSTFVFSLAAQAGTLLPTAFFFHQLPLYGLLINLLLVPVITCVLVPFYALLLPLSFLPAFAPALGSLASLLTDGLLGAVSLLSTLPHASVRVAAPSVPFALGVGLALALLSRRVPGSRKRRALAAVSAALVGLAASWLQSPPPLRYIQLSVGQADSALLMDGSQTVLIDTGADASAALDYLLAENRDLDTLILTHLHLDHAGGVEALLDSGIRIHEVCIPVHGADQRVDPQLMRMLERLDAQKIPVRELASGDELRYNTTRMTVLWPERDTVRAGQSANRYPLVLSVELGGYTLLEASDLDGLYELYAAAPADVLKVAHHGSADSTSDAFLQTVAPSIALISASASSRSLPSPKTLERLEALGIPVLHTGYTGDVTLSVQDGVLSVTPYKGRELP